MRRPSRIALFLVLLALLGLGSFRVGPGPQVEIEPNLAAIGNRTSIQIAAAEPSRGLSSLKVELVQGERVEILLEKDYPFRSPLDIRGALVAHDQVSVEVGRETISGLRSGKATIQVTAGRIGSWLRSPDPVIEAVVLPVRLSPPSIHVLSKQTYVSQGGCEVVVYRVGDSTVRDGVRAGQWFFPGFELPNSTTGERFALFGLPYDMDGPEARLVAIDDAGNEAAVGFIDRFFAKPFKRDSIRISDSFMAKVVPEILAQSTEVEDRGDLLQNYLAINGELRKQNAARLIEFAGHSEPEFLWREAFQALPNAKVTSAFADRRTYVYQDREVDRQDHLGFDLASNSRSPVPAANDGIIVHAGYLGIYGNAVIVDHGYGLQSLNGHLSSVNVQQGQTVAKGETLGLTGETGLAGGDHLHFTILLQGLSVNPIEWWDDHWIRDRLKRKLGPSMPFEE